MTMNGRILPRISSARVAGVTCSCSSVPRSRSRTMALAVNWISVKVRMIAIRPGMMKRDVRRSGLYQGRTRTSMGSCRCVQPARAASVRMDSRLRDPGHDRHGLRRRRRVGRVHDQERLGGLAAMPVLAEVAVDDQRRPWPARSRSRVLHLVQGVDVAHDVEVPGGGHLGHQLAALVGAALVEHDRPQVLDVVVDGVPEDQRLHQRHHDDHAQRHAVALQLQELFPRQGQQSFHAVTSFLRAHALARQRDEHVLERRLGRFRRRRTRRGARARAPGRASAATARTVTPNRYTSSSDGSPLQRGQDVERIAAPAALRGCGRAGRCFSSGGEPSAMSAPSRMNASRSHCSASSM